MKHLFIIIACTLNIGALAAPKTTLTCGKNRLIIHADSQKEGTVTLDLLCNGKTVLAGCRVGLETSHRRFQRMRLIEASPAVTRHDDYHMLQGKRLHCTPTAVCRTLTFVSNYADTLRMEFRLQADGLAFRYLLPAGAHEEMVVNDLTSYPIANGVRRWMADYDVSYECFFPLSTDGQERNKRQQHRWCYPALVEPLDGIYLLITESNIERGHAASWLTNARDETLYRVTFGSQDQPCHTAWASPWHVVIAGSLAQVVESTLVTDVAAPAVTDNTAWVKPAPVSWIYWAYNHGSRELNRIKEYIDLAAEMHWPYMLIDAEWDEMTNGNRVEEALEYAHQRGVKPMLWYNSSTGWTHGAPTPQWRLNKRADRLREFAWLQEHGVAGIKVDFFDGDNRATMDYCIDILEDALRYNLMVVLHGATIPRGWQRTFPNLMTVEGVYGAEWYNNKPVMTHAAAAHNATLPFTRNVVGPMDYTPCAFSDSQHPHITTHCHELALPILFESPLQHMADRPASYLAQPREVRELLSALPTAWDETLLLNGQPGHHVVMARRSGQTWYIAGINGTESDLTLTADLRRLGLFSKVKTAQTTLFTDGDKPFSFAPTQLLTLTPKTKNLTLPCQPRGGFVAVITMQKQ